MLAKRIAAGLGLAIVLAAAVALALDSYSRQQGSTAQKQQPQQSSQTERPAEQQESHKGKTLWERTTEDPVAFFTFWLVIFTAVLAASTIGLWVVTWRASAKQSRDMQASLGIAKQSADTAKAALVASQRPWIKRTTIFFTTDVELRPDGLLHSSVAFECVNGGNAPALHVHMAAIFMTSGPNAAVPEDKAKAFFAEQRGHVISGGFTLFPNESYPRGQDVPTSHGVHLTKDEIDAVTDEAGRMVLYLAACISYVVPSDPTAYHQTSCLFEARTPPGVSLRARDATVSIRGVTLEQSGFLGMDIAD